MKVSMVKLLLTLVLFLAPLLLYAQKDNVNTSFLSQMLKSVELRESFGSATPRTAPVKFQFTLPKDADDSFLIDGALGIPFFDVGITQGLMLRGKIIGEYHRNTLVEEEQYTWQTGFSTELRTKIKMNDRNTAYSQLIFTPTFKYTRNVMDTVNSLVFTMDVIPFRSGLKGINLNTYTLSGNRKLINLLSIIPAVELQHQFSAAQSLDNGTILRPLLKFQYSVGGNKTRIPATRMVEPIKTWQAAVDYTLRYAVVNSTSIGEDFTHLLTTGVDYYFSTSPVSIAFGVSFNYGSDPLQGLRKQQYWLATISIQK
ncbi:hypothetical protein [Pedobacter sp.]|uniref:hypothetical protein n=1 Tax=Pedobacter sp. TaxID=1411316 RepID=UPI003D7F9C52